MNQIPVKKNEKYIVDIIDNGFGGEGIAKVNGFTIFIPNALKGEKCEVQPTYAIAEERLCNLLEVNSEHHHKCEAGVKHQRGKANKLELRITLVGLRIVS